MTEHVRDVDSRRRSCLSSRRTYLKSAVASVVPGVLAGCSGNSGGSEDNDGAADDDEYLVNSSNISDYIEWNHHFTYEDEVYDSVSIIYNISAENTTQNGLLAGSILQISFTNEQGRDDSLDVVVNSDSFEPGYTWSDGRAVVLPSLDSVTGYSIELFVIRPGKDTREAEETFEYTAEEFRNNFQPAE